MSMYVVYTMTASLHSKWYHTWIWCNIPDRSALSHKISRYCLQRTAMVVIEPLLSTLLQITLLSNITSASVSTLFFAYAACDIDSLCSQAQVLCQAKCVCVMYTDMHTVYAPWHWNILHACYILPLLYMHYTTSCLRRMMKRYTMRSLYMNQDKSDTSTTGDHVSRCT
jgi:hypothetical protein